MATALGLEKDECLGIVAGISWKMMNWGLLHYLRVTMEMHIYKLHWILNPTIISINLCCFLKELQEQKVPLSSPAPLSTEIGLWRLRKERETSGRSWAQFLFWDNILNETQIVKRVKTKKKKRSISHTEKPPIKTTPSPFNLYIMEFDTWMNRFLNYHTWLLDLGDFQSCKPKVISKTVFIVFVKFLF